MIGIVYMKDKKILILCGTGALGQTLIQKYYENNKIIIFSRDEHKHYNLIKKYISIFVLFDCGKI